MTHTTREALVTAAATLLVSSGVNSLSARAIAREAGVNQALVFYHFGTVAGLVRAAAEQSTRAAIARYHDRFAAASSLTELLAVGRDLHATEHRNGQVRVLAQLLAASQSDPELAEVSRAALDLWVTEITTVTERLLQASPIAELVDPADLARTVSASFIGLELYAGADPAGAERAFAALDRLGSLLVVLEELNPLERRTLGRRLRRLTP